MKFGMCAPLPNLEKALEAGADYIEVNNARLTEMSDEEFEAFAKMQLALCEKRELLGSSSHLLYICKKK